MGRIFISYSHKNMAFVKSVNEFLNKHHILTWFDINDIKPSDHWDKHIKTAIYSSDVFLMFYSETYLQSTYCQKEFEIAKNKENNANIIIVGLDDATDSFAIHEDISSIQRVNYNYKKNTITDLEQELINIPCIKKCKILDNDISGSKDSFLHGISEIENPKHHTFLNIFIKFLIEIKELSYDHKYISSNANFSSLSLIKGKNNEYKLSLLCENDYSDEDHNTVFLKNVLYSLFNYSFREYSSDLPSSIKFNDLFVGNETYALFNELINEVYMHFDIDKAITSLTDIYNASLYYENISFSKNHNYTEYQYEVNPLLIRVAKSLFIKNNGIKKIPFSRECFPDIALDDDTLFKTDFERNAFAKLLSYDDSDIFLYSEEGIGKTKMMIDYFINHNLSLYIDLNAYASKFDNNIIKNALMNIADSCYKIDYDSLHNYSSFISPIILLIDNFDYLSRSKKSAVLEEIPFLEDAFKIVLVSSKRNVEDNMALNNEVSILKNFTYSEIKPLTKDKIILYLNYLGVSEKIEEELNELEEDDNFFKFFNSFSKLNVLYDSIKELKNFSIKELKNDINSEIKIYQMIYESKSDYSVSKRMSEFFNNTVVPIGDVIQDLMLEEIDKLKEISYSNELDKINDLRFRDYDCTYSILTTNNNKNYKFLNDDIRSYFVASFIASKIKEYKDNYTKLEELLKPVYEDYRVLKYINAFNIFETIDLESLFTKENKNKFLDLKYTLFKVAQYNKDSRKDFASICDLEVIPDCFFYGAENITTINVPKSINYIGRASFTNMAKLTKLIINTNASELVIKPWAIIGCPNLKTIKLGANYKKLNYPLFSQCKELEEIIINPNNEYFTALEDNKILVSKDYKTLYLCVNSLSGDIKLDERIEVLETNSLSYLDNIRSIYLPKSIKELDTNFTDFSTNLERIDVDQDNPYFYSDEKGYLYQNKGDEKILVRVPSGEQNDIIIPSDVTIIGSDSISTCAKTKRIFVPRSVRKIENYSFADTTSLNYLEFEDISRIKKIENYIFLQTNKDLRIGIVDDEDDYIYLNVEKFNKHYNHETVSEFKVDINEKEIDVNMFKDDFEIISNAHNTQTYKKVVVLRNISLFDNLFTYDENNYNILIIGMTEFNTINKKGSLELDEYLDNLISSRHIKLIVFTRDLPLINKLNMYTNRVSIIRTPIGTSKTTKKIIEILNR